MQSQARIFDLFTKMIRDVPARAVLKALALECKTLEDDLNQNRSVLTLDVFSILYFGQFVSMAKRGKTMCVVEAFPPEHIEFYKETIVRLVEANQLLPSAVVEFDQTFTIGV
jgi:hypothetical protein